MEDFQAVFVIQQYQHLLPFLESEEQYAEFYLHEFILDLVKTKEFIPLEKFNCYKVWLTFKVFNNYTEMKRDTKIW